MAIEAAVIDIVGPIEPSKQLQQKTGFVAASSTKVPKRFFSRKLLQLGGYPIEGFIPCDGVVTFVSMFVQDWLNQSTTCFKLPRRPIANLCNRVFGPKISGDCRLHVSRHGLDRFFANFRKGTFFVYHTTMLAPHAQRTSLACVSGSQSPIKLPQASGLDAFSKRISDRLPTAAR